MNQTPDPFQTLSVCRLMGPLFVALGVLMLFWESVQGVIIFGGLGALLSLAGWLPHTRLSSWVRTLIKWFG